MSQYPTQQSPDEEASQQEESPAAGVEETEEMEGAVVAESRPGHNASLLLVGLAIIGGAALYIMRQKAGPQAAAAATPETTTAHATVNEFLSDGGKSIKAMHELLKNTEKVVQQFVNYPSMTQVQVEDLRTNPFRFAAPKDQAEDDAAAAKAKEKAEQERLAKEQLEKEKQRKEIAAAAGALQLQSVMLAGKVRTCMIGNRAYSEGQEVGGFLIEKINPNSVVVKKAGYRFEVRMAR